MRFFLLFIVTIVIVALFSKAYPLVRGNDIYPACTRLQDEPDPNDFKNKKSIMEVSMKQGVLIGYCLGVVGTSFQAIRGIGYTWSVDSNFSRCMEDYYGFADIDANQILDMTIKYLKNHPEHRNIEINAIMALMLHEHYPASVCGGSTPADRTKK